RGPRAARRGTARSRDGAGPAGRRGRRPASGSPEPSRSRRPRFRAPRSCAGARARARPGRSPSRSPAPSPGLRAERARTAGRPAGRRGRKSPSSRGSRTASSRRGGGRRRMQRPGRTCPRPDLRTVAACDDRAVNDAADLGVVEASTALGRRELSARELVDACLARIRERDGDHTFEGDPSSVNAWARVYDEDARAAAEAADERRARGDVPALCGIPIGLKDLYAVAGKPLTASSRVLHEVPDRDCDVWARLAAEGMVLLGHVHTHEFAAGGTTDQVGNPWALDRSPGGSSGGSAAALAARTTPAAAGTDTAGSLRIPSAMCGTSTIKPTRGSVSMRGIVPLCPTLDHPGPM